MLDKGRKVFFSNIKRANCKKVLVEFSRNKKRRGSPGVFYCA